MSSHPCRGTGRDDERRHLGQSSAPCGQEQSPGESVGVGEVEEPVAGEGQETVADPVDGDPPEGYERL
jgi:hypothetical protein